MYLLELACGVATMWCPRRAFVLAWGGLTAIILAVHASVFVLGVSAFRPMVVYATSVQAMIEVAPCFMLGGCVALAGQRLPLRPLVALGLLGIGMVLARSPWPVEPLLVLVTACAVIALGTASFPVINRSGRLGDTPDGLFLWGFLVAQLLSWRFDHDLPRWAHTGLTILLTGAVAMAS